MKAIIFLFALLLLITNPTISQKWGKVSKETLQMTSISEDPEADAVILFDIGEIEISANFYLIFKRHRRIKILSEEGKKHADVRIGFWHEYDIREFDVQTFLPTGKKIKLKDEDIFEEEGDWWKYKVFAFPGVEVGSVLEYRYEYSSEYLHFLEPWQFQNRAFTLLSQLSVMLQPGFNYNAFFTNTHTYGTDPEPEVENFLIPRGNIAQKGQKFIWKVENLEPIKPEPYMTTIDDYLMTMHFQLVHYKGRSFYQRYINSWDDLANRLSKNYDDLLSENSGLADLAIEITSHCKTDIEKASTIYDFICNSIETSGAIGLFAHTKPSSVYEDKKGSPTEKNILLINLLRHSGLQADPVIISTRSHGKISETYPSLQQFNHVIVRLKTANKEYFLDCRDKYCPFGVLPPSDIVYRGLLVHKKSGKIVKIPEPKGLNKLNIITKAIVNEEGSLSCNSNLIYEGYSAIYKRKDLSKKVHQEYIEEMLKKKFPEAEVDSFKISGLDNLKLPVEIEIDYQVPNFVDLNGEMVYMQSPIIDRFESNPFKSQERNFPVEYNYDYVSSEKIEVTLPDNLSIVEMPRPRGIRKKGISFYCMIEHEENVLKFERQYTRSKNYYSRRQYTMLRDFFSKVVSVDDAIVVLSKKEM